jgi:hypothetical protein
MTANSEFVFKVRTTSFSLSETEKKLVCDLPYKNRTGLSLQKQKTVENQKINNGYCTPNWPIFKINTTNLLSRIAVFLFKNLFLVFCWGTSLYFFKGPKKSLMRIKSRGNS